MRVVKKKISLEQFTSLLRQLQGDSTQLSLAKRLEVSPAYLNDVLKGKRLPGPSVAEKLGFKRVIMFEEIKERNNGQTPKEVRKKESR